MWGNISRSTYGYLNSVPTEINGIISVVITSSRVKPTLVAPQGCLLKICVPLYNQGRCISKCAPTKAILNYSEGKGPERNVF